MKLILNNLPSKPHNYALQHPHPHSHHGLCLCPLDHTLIHTLCCLHCLSMAVCPHPCPQHGLQPCPSLVLHALPVHGHTCPCQAVPHPTPSCLTSQPHLIHGCTPMHAGAMLMPSSITFPWSLSIHGCACPHMPAPCLHPQL